jgi:hypothetical protein
MLSLNDPCVYVREHMEEGGETLNVLRQSPIGSTNRQRNKRGLPTSVTIITLWIYLSPSRCGGFVVGWRGEDEMERGRARARGLKCAGERLCGMRPTAVPFRAIGLRRNTLS